MKFNKEKTKKFASGGKTPKEIMEEARRNQLIERQAQARDAVKTSGIPTFQSQQVSINVPRPTVDLTLPELTQRSDLKSMFKTRGEAFNYARKQGWTDFTWGGGRFHTRTAEEEAKAASNTSKKNTSTEQQSESQQSAYTNQTNTQYLNLGQPSNAPYIGSGRTSFNVSGLDLSRLVIPEGQQYGQSQEDTENTEDTEDTEYTEYTEGKTSQGQLLRIGNPTNTWFNINPNFRNRSGLDLSRLVLPPVLPIRTSPATTVTNRFNTPIMPLGKNPVSRNPYYQQGGQLPSYQQGNKLHLRNVWERLFGITPDYTPVNSQESITSYMDNTWRGPVEKRVIRKEVPYGDGNLHSTMSILNPGTHKSDTIVTTPEGITYNMDDVRSGKVPSGYGYKFFKKPTGYFQQGGTIDNEGSGSTDQLYVDFAIRYLKAKGISEDDMVDDEGGLRDEFVEEVTTAINEIDSPDFWEQYQSNPDAVVQSYVESKMEPEQIEMARKGAKLKKLKKGGIKSRKCKCGCNLTMKKEAGGKIVEVCACGCKSK